MFGGETFSKKIGGSNNSEIYLLSKESGEN